MTGFARRVTDGGQKSFVLVTRYPGSASPAPRAIGDYPLMDLAKARDIAREIKDDIKNGVDPRDKAEAARKAVEAAKRARRARRKTPSRRLGPNTSKSAGATETVGTAHSASLMT